MYVHTIYDALHTHAHNAQDDEPSTHGAANPFGDVEPSTTLGNSLFLTASLANTTAFSSLSNAPMFSSKDLPEEAAVGSSGLAMLQGSEILTGVGGYD